MDYSSYEDLSDMGDLEVEEEKKPNVLLYVGIGCAVLVAAGIISAVIIKKKRRKLMEEIDEDEIS